MPITSQCSVCINFNVLILVINMRVSIQIMVLCTVNKAAAVLPYPLCSGNQLLNDSRAGIKVVTSETFASDSLSIEVMFASGKVSVRCVSVNHATKRCVDVVLPM